MYLLSLSSLTLLFVCDSVFGLEKNDVNRRCLADDGPDMIFLDIYVKNIVSVIQALYIRLLLIIEKQSV